MAQAGPISNVPLDGSASVTVPFPQPYASYVQSVQVTYAPGTETDYTVTLQVLPISPATSTATSLVGFVLVASGAPAGTIGSFTYEAHGL